MSAATSPAREHVHVHVWIHVGTVDNRLVCKCTCGRSLTASQIESMREANGVTDG